jgi:threonine/homoserine/homoserine lactone efflux protein
MTAHQTLAFIGFAMVVAGTPGPSNALLTATGAVTGVARGAPAVIGVGLGMASMMFVVVFGLGTLVIHTPLILLAVKLSASSSSSGLRGKSVLRDRCLLIRVGPLACWARPRFSGSTKSWLACTSAAAAYLDPGRGSMLQKATELALVFALVAVPCCFVWLAFGAVVQRSLRTERAARLFNMAMGGLLAVSVALFLVD